jgi:tartrate dehydratase beta subunit/fumarate hydratase class I family protein
MSKNITKEALQAVWNSGLLNKKTALENISLDGTVHKFDDPLTQKVWEAMKAEEGPSDIKNAAIFALTTLQDMADHGVDEDTFNKGGAGYEAVELLFKVTR